MVDFEIGQGDLLPVINSFLKQDGAAVDLTGASVKFHMEDVDGDVVVNAAATIVTAATGEVKYDWVSGDTANEGTYQAEWQVTYPGSKPITFPRKTKMTIIIYPSIA